MAGFQTSPNGRFWVSPEGQNDTAAQGHLLWSAVRYSPLLDLLPFRFLRRQDLVGQMPQMFLQAK